MVKTANNKEKAEVLGKFFSSVFTNEPEGDFPELPTKEVPEFKNIETDKKNIEEAIK